MKILYSVPTMAALMAIAVGCLGLAVVPRAAAASEEARTLGVSSAPPLLLEWVRPVYPEAVDASRLEEWVKVRFIVDATGSVSRVRAMASSNAAFETAAVKSVEQWKFVPGGARDHPEVKCMDVTVRFRRNDPKRAAHADHAPADVRDSLRMVPVTDPVKASGDDPEYPASMLPRHFSGAVSATLSIDQDGRVAAVKILAASHSDFVRPALDAVNRWTFQPATQGDLTIPGHVDALLEFTYFNSGAEPVPMATATELLVARTEDGKELDRQPEILVVVDPVYPYEAQLAGEEGEARADMAVKADGTVESVTVLSATRPEFGRALVAALECWVFKPAERHGLPVPVLIARRHAFKPAGNGAVSTTSAARLIDRITAGNTADMVAKGLDARLRPRFQAAPEYPKELLDRKLAGTAEVEFILDMDGRCRLARIVKASDERFGWAAATAVERWVFDPPKRAGVSVDVRLRIPFEFKPPQ